MENLTGYKEEVNMSASVERGRKRTNIILIIGVILLFAIRCMDFYGVEGVSVYSGLVSVEKYWLAFAMSSVCVGFAIYTVATVVIIAVYIVFDRKK